MAQGKANPELYKEEVARSFNGKFVPSEAKFVDDEEVKEKEGDAQQATADESTQLNHCKMLSDNSKSSLTRINPIYNARFDKVQKAKDFFRLKVAKLMAEKKL